MRQDGLYLHCVPRGDAMTMGAFVYTLLSPPPHSTTVFVRDKASMRNAYVDRFGKWWTVPQHHAIKETPPEWWDPAADENEPRPEAPAPPRAPSEGQMSFDF